jgi:hypothetical protein
VRSRPVEEAAGLSFGHRAHAGALRGGLMALHRAQRIKIYILPVL